MHTAGHSIWSSPWMALIIFLVLGMGALTFLFFYQSKMIYFPQKGIYTTPESIGISYEDVVFETSEGNELNGWYVHAENARGVILFCHGNAGNISHRLVSIEQFLTLGFSVFIFDYRGFGKSEGKPTEHGTYTDAEAAWKFLTDSRSVPPEKVAIFGRSVGGSVAAWLATLHTPGALIVESCFTSMPDLAQKLYPFLPVKLLIKYKYNTLEYLANATCPVLIAHSPEDDMIPYENAEKLFEVIKTPREFLEMRGSHNDGFLDTGQDYTNGLDNFLSMYFVSKNIDE